MQNCSRGGREGGERERQTEREFLFFKTFYLFLRDRDSVSGEGVERDTHRV